MIEYIDPVSRIIYLDDSTVNSTIQPIDIYREMRVLRRTDETLRKYDLFATMKGAEKKNPDGSKRTERYLVLLDGTLIAPYDTSHILTIDGTMITDTGLEGVECFNRANLSSGVEVNINYVPKQVEVITITTGSGVTPQDKLDIATKVWENSVRDLTSEESGGATAQEVWEYATRELTSTVSSVIMSDVVQVDVPTNITMKINYNPTNENYAFDVYYRNVGMNSFETLDIQLTEIEFDLYQNSHTFDSVGSCILKFSEVDNKINDTYFNITVMNQVSESVEETWELTI